VLHADDPRSAARIRRGAAVRGVIGYPECLAMRSRIFERLEPALPRAVKERSRSAYVASLSTASDICLSSFGSGPDC